MSDRLLQYRMLSQWSLFLHRVIQLSTTRASAPLATMVFTVNNLSVPVQTILAKMRAVVWMDLAVISVCAREDFQEKSAKLAKKDAIQIHV